MAKRGASYTLSVLLKLNDQLSGRLNKSVAALRRFDKQSRTSLAGYDLLRKSLNKPVSTAGLGRYDTKLKSVSKSLRAVVRDKNKLDVAMGRKPARGTAAGPGVERAPAPRRPAYDGHVREYLARERARRSEQEEAARIREQTRRQADRQARLRARADRTLSTVRARQARRAADDFLGSEEFGARRPRARRAERGRLRRFADRTDALDDTFDSTRQIVHAWRDRFESLRPYTDAAIRQVRSRARLKIIGLTRGEHDIANQAVERTGREVRSASTTDERAVLMLLLVVAALVRRGRYKGRTGVWS